jgi:muramoyltetrapeptide carboxypeptidase
VSLLNPAPLQPGARVAIVAPSGPFDRQAFEKGLSIVAERYQPVFTDRLFDRQRYLAGSDSARAHELQTAFDDDDLKAIFVARGGYGAMRLLPSMRLSTPKWLVGFSDVTALHLAVQTHGWCSVHAPVVTQLGTQSTDVSQRLFQALEGHPLPPLVGRKTVIPGFAEGPLMGGNLSVLTRLIGTPFLPSLNGAILLLEDIGERPYRLDRMWTHLKLAGVLHGLRGVVLGDFTGCEESGATYSSADVLENLVGELGLPCASGFTVGHGDINCPIRLGAQVQLDANAQTVSEAR